MARELKVVLTGDNKDLARSFRAADKDAGRFESRMEKTSKRAKAAFAGIGIAAATGLGLAAKQAIAFASDLDESLTKNQQLFGKSARTIDAWSKTTAASLGISRAEAVKATGTFGGLFNALRIGEKSSADMSVRLTKLAADLASFNNASPEEALDALRSGLAGESEPMRRFNAFLSEGRVKLEAYRSGIAKQGSELTEQQKVQARYNLILKDTAKAHGDFARTSGGLANQQRILKAELVDASTALGEELLPVATDAAKALTKFIGQMRDGKGAGGEFAEVAGDVAHVLGQIGGFLKDNPKLIAAAAVAWGTYKVASVAALAAIKVKNFRDAFAKGKAPAASQGALAGRTYATTFAGSSAETMPGAFGKQQGKMSKASRALGGVLGLAMAAGFAVAFAPEIEKVFNDFVKEAKGRLEGLADGAGSIFDDLTGPFHGGKSRAEKFRDSNKSGVGAGDSSPLTPNPIAPLPKADRESNRPRRRAPRPRGQSHGGRASASTSRVGARGASVARASQSGGSGIVALGRQLQSEGYQVGEHPSFGGVAPVHVNGSYHYRGLALDVNGGPGGEPGSLDALYARLQGKPGVVELLWRVKGHFDHLHVAVVGSSNPLGGSSAGSTGSSSGGGGSSAPAAAPRPAPPKVTPMSPAARFRESQSAASGRAGTAQRNAAKRAAGRRARRGVGRNGLPMPGGPGKGVEREPTSMADLLAGMPTGLDFANRDLSLAGLTEDKSDDLKALRSIEAYWQGKLDEAAKTADPRDDIEAADALASVRESITSLDESIQNANALAEQRLALDKELVANQTKILALAGQGDAVIAAVVAAVNGGIGGRVGLGFHGIRTPAGNVANL